MYERENSTITAYIPGVWEQQFEGLLGLALQEEKEKKHH